MNIQRLLKLAGVEVPQELSEGIQARTKQNVPARPGTWRIMNLDLYEHGMWSIDDIRADGPIEALKGIHRNHMDPDEIEWFTNNLQDCGKDTYTIAGDENVQIITKIR